MLKYLTLICDMTRFNFESLKDVDRGNETQLRVNKRFKFNMSAFYGLKCPGIGLLQYLNVINIQLGRDSRPS